MLFPTILPYNLLHFIVLTTATPPTFSTYSPFPTSSLWSKPYRALSPLLSLVKNPVTLSTDSQKRGLISASISSQPHLVSLSDLFSHSFFWKTKSPALSLCLLIVSTTTFVLRGLRFSLETGVLRLAVNLLLCIINSLLLLVLALDCDNSRKF